MVWGERVNACMRMLHVYAGGEVSSCFGWWVKQSFYMCNQAGCVCCVNSECTHA
jgi:hypothetical protein